MTLIVGGSQEPPAIALLHAVDSLMGNNMKTSAGQSDQRRHGNI